MQFSTQIVVFFYIHDYLHPMLENHEIFLVYSQKINVSILQSKGKHFHPQKKSPVTRCSVCVNKKYPPVDVMTFALTKFIEFKYHQVKCLFYCECSSYQRNNDNKTT